MCVRTYVPQQEATSNIELQRAQLVGLAIAACRCAVATGGGSQQRACVALVDVQGVSHVRQALMRVPIAVRCWCVSVCVCVYSV
jgi:hypothetical protein